MAKMQGMWRQRPKIDQAEFEAAQTRVAERLADLFGLEAPASDGEMPPAETADEATEADSPTQADQELVTEADQELEAAADQELEAAAPDPPSWHSAARPAVVVEGEPDLVDIPSGPAPAESGLLGVTAGTGEAAARAAAPAPFAPTGARDPVTRRSAAVRSDPSPSVASPGAGPSPRRRAPAAATEPTRAEADATNGRARSTRVRRPAARPTQASAKKKAAPSPTSATPSCPYCAILLQPPPASSQRCAHCRQRIVVKRVAGRAAYLTEAAVLVFEAERRRLASAAPLMRERARWLELAAAAGAPSKRAARLAAAPLSQDVVDGARTLYFATIERSFQVAKRERRWEDAAQTRREHALALYRVAGSPVPPPAEIVKLHRDGVAAELRGIAEIAPDAELVGAACCDACRADDGRVLKIAAELRVPRLPHDGCPKGLCRCEWGLTPRHRTAIQHYLRRRARADQRVGQGDNPPTA